METTGFVHRLVAWTGTAFYVASTLALVSLCWSDGHSDSDHHVLSERDLGIGSVGSSQDDNASGSTVDAEPLFPASRKIAHSKRHLMLVSTMDGYLTAVDAITGVDAWSVSTGLALVSSSISKFEITNSGQKKRLVPSLDGSLYQVDNEGIEPVPLAADFLLSSSFRFSEDLTVVGGKEVETYGIDLNTGKVRYLCSAAGCKYFDADSKSNAAGLQTDEVLVLSRTTNTVRAIEMQSGIEKWNFSVGQLDVAHVAHKSASCDSSSQHQYLDRIAAHSSHHVDETCPKYRTILVTDEEDEYSDQCQVQTVLDDYEDIGEHDERGEHDESVWSQPTTKDVDIDLKVVVPTGYVLAVDRLNPSLILWQQRFKAAIANVWVLRDEKLTEVSLFSTQVIPDFMWRRKISHDKDFDDESDDDPLLYIGVHDDQLYIQPSVQMMREVEAAATDAVQQGRVDMPRVCWSPYMITALSRTPTASPPRHSQIGPDERPTSTAMVPWHEQYPFDGGYYLFPDCHEVIPVKLLTLNVTEQEEDNDITVSLLNWWKEVVGISAVTSLFVNLLIYKCKRSITKRLLSRTGEDACKVNTTNGIVVTDTNTQDSKSTDSNADGYKPPEFTSRYVTDFHQEACLGRGGFGVVFRARNRLDDCVYAVKRIALNDSEQARQKVTREVKALAKLDHSGIVRYYQSWFECPPPGWQEERDKVSIDLSLATQTAGLSPTGGLSSAKTAASQVAVSLSSEDEIQQYLLRNNDNVCRCPISSSGCDENRDMTWSSESVSLSNQADNEVSLQIHSASDNSSVDTSFQYSRLDSYDSSKKLSNYGSGDAACTESSLSIVFEDSANNGTDVQYLPKTEALPDPVVAPADRPHVLEIKNTNSDNCQHVPEKEGKAHRKKLYLYIQMQLCQPESLKDWLRDNTLSRDKYQLLNMFHQIVGAIGYVHQIGLMHRDLKPSNIFFAMDGSVKIGDFGLVTAIEENCCDNWYGSVHAPLSLDSRHTDQVGTKLYMSPEQSAGRSYTHKVDIYALGMIFFELFYPFATEMERISTLLNVQKLEFPARFVRELPEEATFVRPLLSHDPDSRPSADEILQHRLVSDFEEASRAYQKLRTHSRDRTASSSSGNSAGGDGPSSQRTVD